MTTLTRSTSRTTPNYKDYVNFLEAYKNGRKDENSDSRNFPLSNSSTSTSSSSLSSDVTDFSKSSCVSYNTFLENTKNKKFNSVKPTQEEKIEKKTERSEIFIEIQPVKSVSEVSKIFEKKETNKSASKSKINAKINVFERQISNEKPKLANKPTLGNKSPPPKIEIEIKPPLPPPAISTKEITVNESPEVENIPTPPPPPPPMMSQLAQNDSNPPPLLITTSATSQNGTTLPPPMISETNLPPPPPPMMNNITKNGTSLPPPPPPMMNVATKKTIQNGTSSPPPPPPMTHTVPRMQATLTRGPQIKHTVNNPNGIPHEIDRNDPMVRKLVYGTLRGLYGAYHDKANDMMATLPRDRVKKSNGVQDIIEKIASSGDLDKLNGRVNPKLEQE